MKLIECVPNVSEGRDRGLLDALAAAITSVEGIRLLDVDPGAATHRTVFTFVGPPQAVELAAFALIEKAAGLIDMRSHKGAHPRLGATDVCPFVPLAGATMSECVAMAQRVGRAVGERLRIPVYLYEEAASAPERRSLSDIRKGEYEGLGAKLEDPRWAPDFGPAEMNERAGATVIGAREFLIAYNVSLNTRDRKLAAAIAADIRETGRPKRDGAGRIVRDAAGITVMEPGPSQLSAVRATGWFIEEYGQAQVSINLTDYKVTPPHVAFEAVEKEAARLGLRVTGSEIVGLVPLEAILMAGRHFLQKQGKSPAANQADLVRSAVISLGLEDVAPFDPVRKIVEYAVTAPPRLASMTLAGFVDEVSAATPAPGGGTVAALAGALASGLTAMVAAISYEHKGSESRRDQLARLGLEAQALKARLLEAADEDARAFDRLMGATRLPRGGGRETKAREEAIQEATRGAIDVPLAVMRDALRALELAGTVMEIGLPSALSDAGVAALLACGAVEGAGYNVRINLPGLTDDALAAALRSEAEGMLRSCAAHRVQTEAILRRSPATA